MKTVLRDYFAKLLKLAVRSNVDARCTDRCISMFYNQFSKTRQEDKEIDRTVVMTSSAMGPCAWIASLIGSAIGVGEGEMDVGVTCPLTTLNFSDGG